MTFNKSKVLEDIQKYIQKGLIDKAIEEYEKILKIDPRDYKLRQKLGDLYLRKGKNAEAVNQYMQVAENYVKDGFSLKAIALYSQILRIDPSKLFIYEKLADLYKKQGLIGDAVSKLRTLAEIYEKQKKLSEAIQTWENIINIAPDNIIYRGKLIEFYLKQGLATRAEEKLRQAVDYFKSNGRYDDVETLLSHFPGLLAEDKTFVIKIVRSLYENGKYKEAINKLEQYLKSNTKDSEAYYLKGACYLGLNQINLAKNAFEMALRLSPSSIDARKGLLKIAVKEKNWSQLILLLEDLFKLYSDMKAYDDFKSLLDNYYPYLPEERRLIQLYIELFRITGDLKSLKEKLKKLANIYVKENKKEEALALFKEVLTLDNSDDDAIDFLKRNAALHVTDETIVKNQGLSESVQPEGDRKSVTIIEDIITEEVEESVIEKELEEIDNLLKFGLISKALSLLEKLSSMYPDSPAVKEKWFEYFSKTKDNDAAYMVLRELLDLYKKEENAEKIQYYERILKKRFPYHKEEIDEKSYPPEEKEPEEEILQPEDLEVESEISTPNVEDILIEADFYFKNDMVDEAINAYEKVLLIEPQNPIAKERLGILKKTSKQVPIEDIKVENEEKEGFYDISGEILKEFEQEELLEGTFKSEREKITFEELFKEFKNKISQEIEEGDVETHYNLGIAYKEMGLYDDAIQEFILTSRFPQKTYDSYVMIATCLAEKKEYEKAAQFFKRALKVPDILKENIAGVYLELGSIYEKLEDFEKAIISYNKASKIDPSLKIAKEKVNNLLLDKPELLKWLDKEDLPI